MTPKYLSLAASLLITSGLFLATGPLGGLVGLTTLPVLLLAPAPFGVVYAQLAVATFAPGLPPVLLAAELGVLLAFAAALPTHAPVVPATALLAVVAGGWVFWVWPATTPFIATLALLAIGALALYGVHRFELVRLNLINT